MIKKWEICGVQEIRFIFMWKGGYNDNRTKKPFAHLQDDEVSKPGTVEKSSTHLI